MNQEQITKLKAILSQLRVFWGIYTFELNKVELFESIKKGSIIWQSQGVLMFPSLIK